MALIDFKFFWGGLEGTDSSKDKEKELKSYSFAINKIKKKFLYLLGWIVVIAAAVLTLDIPEYISHLWCETLSPQTLRPYSIGIQTLFILMVILLPIREKHFQNNDTSQNCPSESTEKNCFGYPNQDDWHRAQRNANQSIIQYKHAWNIMWGGWLLFYVTLYFLHDDVIIKKILSNLFNNISTTAILTCYIILSKITSDQDNPMKENPPSRGYIKLFKYLKFITPYLVNQKNDKPPRKIYIYNLKHWTFFAVIILGVFTALDILFLKRNYFLLIVGPPIVAGLVTALFIGRLNNKFINPPIITLSCLYIYAVIQVSYPLLLFTNDEYSRVLKSIRGEYLPLILINAAFLFKIFLYFFMSWLFKSGKLLFYFVKMRLLIDQDEVKFDNFIKIYHTRGEKNKTVTRKKNKESTL